MHSFASYLSVACLLYLLSVAPALSQIQIGTIKGKISGPANVVVSDVKVSLRNALTGYSHSLIADENGSFIFNNVPFDLYSLHVEAAGFQSLTQSVSVRSNLTVFIKANLSVAEINESVTIRSASGLIKPDSSSTERELDESFISRAPGTTRSASLQKLIATTPGWTTENNGLIHIRGVDDGILYVLDGIPTADRQDALSASSYEIDMIRSMNIITGNIPAEFGGRSGAVVVIKPRSGIDSPFAASLNLSAGNFRSKDVGYTVAGGNNKSLGFFIANSAKTSDRFLDPVDPRNFHNRGGAVKFNVRSDWHPTANDILFFNLSINGTDFRVPNDFGQELANQKQRQELRDSSQSVSWQRTWSSDTVTNVALFRRSYQSRLFGSAFDTPLFAEQSRRHGRDGIIASVTHLRAGHTIKAGVEAARVTPHEFFTFAITDEDKAEERDVSEAAQAFTVQNPFVFSDRKTRGQISGYVQDLFSPVRNLTVNAGLRYDHSSLLASDQQLSPRIGAVYFMPKTGTAVRASFNRLYMPPQVENLLLADSEQARQLSPFANEQSGGGALIRPERVSAYEVGFAQDIFGFLKLDTAYWWRNFRNFDDPNVFFNTTIIFPNSVARVGQSATRGETLTT